MPLAHPISVTRTDSFGEPAFAVFMALAHPGEAIDDFQLRIASRGEWGQTRFGRQKIEMVLTRDSADQLVAMLKSDSA